MRVTIETDAENFVEKYKDLLPEGATEVKAVYEFEVHWYQMEWYVFKWFQFQMWLCTLLVPSLKNEPNNIKFE